MSHRGHSLDTRHTCSGNPARGPRSHHMSRWDVQASLWGLGLFVVSVAHSIQTSVFVSVLAAVHTFVSAAVHTFAYAAAGILAVAVLGDCYLLSLPELLPEAVLVWLLEQYMEIDFLKLYLYNNR